MNDIKLPFGIRDGEIVHISEVSRGLACRCVCPACKEPLVARKGSVTVHHFAHCQAVQCAKAVESALHAAAKKILAERREITLPAVRIHFDSYRDPILLAPEQTYALDDVREERRTGDIVPDLLAFSGSTPLLIEIRVTHAVDETKLRKIRALGISAIEIDLSAACRNFVLDELTDVVTRQTTNKQWLLNVKSERYKQMFLQSGERLKVVQRGLALHVDYCPISARVWKGKPYANVIDDCTNCQFALHVPTNMEFILCGGRHKLTTIDELRVFYNQRGNTTAAVSDAEQGHGGARPR